MRQRGTDTETASSFIVTILPTDTLLCALLMMERHRLRLLPVVEETGVLLGLVSEAHVLQGWGEDPLRPVGEVMEVCGLFWGEEETRVEWTQRRGAWRREQARGA